VNKTSNKIDKTNQKQSKEI